LEGDDFSQRRDIQGGKERERKGKRER
jgi:hypothetical protein